MLEDWWDSSVFVRYNMYRNSAYLSSSYTPSYRPHVPTRVLEQIQVFNTRVEVVHGDIVNEEVGAITNAANEELWLGGGVAGAINDRAGPEVNLHCKEYVRMNGKVPVGGAIATGAGQLRCTFIIHAVGPTYRQGQPNDEMLRQTIISVLRQAEELGIESVSIPAISSGIYGFPTHECANIMFTVLGEYLQEHIHTCLRQVRFTNIDKDTVDNFTTRFNMVKDQFHQLDAYLRQATTASPAEMPADVAPTV